MKSTESKYNFYERAFKGGAQTTNDQVQQQPVQEQPVQQQPVQEQPVQQQTVQQQEGQQQPVQEQQQYEGQQQVSTGELQDEGLNQLNQQVPKTKVDFKIATIIGNLDQTLGSKQKINIDNLFMLQLFGSN
jgi:hypothetical protein